jgi:hypothetical protein
MQNFTPNPAFEGSTPLQVIERGQGFPQSGYCVAPDGMQYATGWRSNFKR